MDQIVRTHGVGRVGLDVARLAPRAHRPDRAGPEARQADVQLHEGAARVERAELFDPVLALRPGRERGAQLRLERVVAPEDPARLAAAARLVELGRAPELARLGVVAYPEREHEGWEALARLWLDRGLRSGVALVGAEHRRAGDDHGRERRERGDDQRGAGARGHAGPH